MDNQNVPSDNEPAVHPEQSVPPPVVDTPQNPPKKPHNSLILGLAAALILLLAALIPVAYIMGRQSAVTDLSSAVSTDTSQTTDDESEQEAIEETMEDISDTNKGWITFENKTYGYSFKYPSGWKIKNTSSSATGNRVSANPPNEADSDRGDVLAFSTYADGVGCPATKTKEFSVGGHVVEGTACEESEVYRVAMKHSAVASRGGQGVVLARAAPNAISIQIDMGRGEDEAIRLILDSVKGLTP